MNTSLVGTTARKRREVPGKVKTGSAKLYDTYVVNNNGTTLTIYQGKRKQCYSFELFSCRPQRMVKIYLKLWPSKMIQTLG